MFQMGDRFPWEPVKLQGGSVLYFPHELSRVRAGCSILVASVSFMLTSWSIESTFKAFISINPEKSQHFAIKSIFTGVNTPNFKFPCVYMRGSVCFV